MSRKSISQLLLILAGVVLFLAIYFAPNQASEVKDEISATAENHEGHDHAEGEEHLHVSEYDGRLNTEDSNLIISWESKALSESNTLGKITYYDSLIAMGIQRNVPPIVAKYTEMKAEVAPTEENFMLAGDNYFKAFRLSKQKPKELAEGAIRNYNKVLEIDAENLDAVTAKGVVYVESASQLGVMPMKGIGILKEVINKDPQNVNALTNLGYFAIQSGQYEKAIERFNTVLSIEPDNAEAYIYLTDVYLSQDDVEKGIETLEKYKALVDDPLAKQQVEDYINDIKVKNNIKN